MLMRRHVMLVLTAAALLAHSGHAETAPSTQPPALTQVLESVQKPAPEIGLRLETKPHAAPTIAPPVAPAPAAEPEAKPAAAVTPPAPATPAEPATAVPFTATEAPPVQRPPAMQEPVAESKAAAAIELPAETVNTGSDQTAGFLFLPLLPSASDIESIPALWPLLSSQKLETSLTQITRAVILIHDADREAEAGLNRLRKLAGNVVGGADARTIIFAPLFPTEAERPAFKKILQDDVKHLAVWSPDNWVYGGETQVVEPQQQSVSSMLALDVLLLYLADQKSFPNLRTIVIAGAGSGGDFVQRYALFGRAPDIIAEQKLKPRFVVAGAQSYAYLTDARPRSGADGFAPPSEAAQQSCAHYQDYPYGLEATNAYAQQTAVNTARVNFPPRDVVYLYGAQDTSPAHDQSCAAKLQGGSVKARASNYEHYLQFLYPDVLAQRFVALPGVGGNADKIWGSSCGISVLFADGECLKSKESAD